MNPDSPQRITSYYRRTISGSGEGTEHLATYAGEFFDAMMGLDAPGAKQVIQTALAADVAPEAIVLDIFCPAMDRFGVLQANQEITLSEIYAVARIGDNVLDQLMPLMPKSKRIAGTVVVGTVAGDFHGMGAKIVGTFLRMAGFVVHELGINVPAAAFVNTAVEKGASVICASTLLLHTLDRIREIRHLLQERQLEERIKLVVGGAPFNFDDQLYKTVHADATAVNAMDAIEVVSQLTEAVRMKEMSSLERVLATVQNHKPDRVPVFPIMLMQGAAALGMDLEQYFSQGQNWANGQLKLLEKFGHDCVLGVTHVVQDITAFGANIMYWAGGPPSPGSMAIRSYQDIAKLQAPDPHDSPQLVETLKAIEHLAHEVKGRVPIIGAVIAPFSLPSMLMGTEKWMNLLLFEEEAVRAEVMGRILDIAVEFSTHWANAQLQAGADVIVLADGMASAAVINRQQFTTHALPILKRTVPLIKGPVVHEGVGHLHPMLDLLLDIGLMGVILSHRDDITLCRQIVGDKLTLIGNLNNIEMLRWTPEEMRQKARAVLSAAAPGNRFILSAQGPEIPLGVSDEVLYALVQVVREWEGN